MEFIDINDSRFHIGTMINVHQKQILKEQNNFEVSSDSIAIEGICENCKNK